MRFPLIRYPLPTILGLALAGFLAWSLQDLVWSAWNTVSSGWRRVVEGPAVPASKEPMRLADGIARRGLLLHPDTATRVEPDGERGESIPQRMFVDIYDVWPLSGEPTHYRVGNGGAIGWVSASDLLAWSTRLVRRGGEKEGGDSEPILEWRGDSVRVAVWKSDAPWSEIETTGWAPISSIEEDQRGLLLSRDEVLELIRELGPSETSPSHAPHLRLRAAVGLLLSSRPLSETSRSEVRGALPAWVFQTPAVDREKAREALERLNEAWNPDATWGSLEFAFVPLSMIP